MRMIIKHLTDHDEQDGVIKAMFQAIPVSSHVVNYYQQQWQHTRGSINRGMKASEAPRRHIKWRKKFYKNNRLKKKYKKYKNYNKKIKNKKYNT